MDCRIVERVLEWTRHHQESMLDILRAANAAKHRSS
jgi:hypothetical protein